MPALAIALSSSAISSAASSSSPSSFWICFICSRSTYSRCRSSIASLVCSSISRDSLQHLDAVREQLEHPVEPLVDVERLEDLLLLRRLDVEEGRRPMSASAPGDSIALDALAELGGRLRQQLRSLRPRFCFSSSVRASTSVSSTPRVGQELDARDEERQAAQVVEHAEAPLALADQVMRAVRRRDVTHDRGDRADPVQVVGRRTRPCPDPSAAGTRPCARAHGFLRARPSSARA